MNYACNREHIEHYESLCMKLREHWLKKYPNDIEIITYEELIQSPQKTLSKALNLLGEEWDDACLDFYNLHNAVKTASVWQVRQPLNDKSIGRAKHYPR
jgi:hypothetical protein